MPRKLSAVLLAVAACAALASLPPAATRAAQKKKAPEEWKAPALPDGKEAVTDTSEDFLKKPAGLALKDGATVAKAAPAVDFAYFPGQTYAGKPWSCWGESTFANGKYYASFGDHLAPAGSAYVYEYDPAKKTFRQLVDLKKLLNRPDGHYSPAKIHTALTVGKDGYIYFGTHRGSTTVTTDKYHYEGDWLVRVHPDAKPEVVVHAPVPKHCIPTGFLDPERLIFYGSTAPGTGKDDATGVHFFAYDVQNKKVLCDVADGPKRAMIFAKSTGRVYYVPASGTGLVRFDPAKPGAPAKIEAAEIDIRAASDETRDGIVYAVGTGQGGREPTLYAFDTRAEKVTALGSPLVGGVSYITALKIDPTGRYLYYIPGAHGGADKDGTPVVQYDTKNKTKKVIAFLHPFYKDKYGVAVVGTYSYALSPKGDDLYVTWNANRSASKAWDTCALTVIRIPESERTTD
jgi:hypothetical protein